MTKPIFYDKEIRPFYWIVIGIPALSAVIWPLQGRWTEGLAPLLFALGFAVLGPPLSAEVMPDNEYILFKGPIRRSKVSAESLIRVKVIGAHDYRAHIVLRNKYGLPIMYRCRKYDNAPVLATAVLRLIENAPQAKVSTDALKLLDGVEHAHSRKSRL